MAKCAWWACEVETVSLCCSKPCKNKYYVDLRRRKNKLVLVAEHGGKCVQCGYARCVGALEFHHLDANAKVFGIGSGNTSGLDALRAEATKCVLLCANCHREVEDAPFADRWLKARQLAVKDLSSIGKDITLSR